MSSVLAEVRILVKSLPLQIESPIGDNDSLVASGMLDSMALFSLYQWIERKVGRPLNPLELDFEIQWDTIAAITSFIEVTRAQP